MCCKTSTNVWQPGGPSMSPGQIYRPEHCRAVLSVVSCRMPSDNGDGYWSCRPEARLPVAARSTMSCTRTRPFTAFRTCGPTPQTNCSTGRENSLPTIRWCTIGLDVRSAPPASPVPRWPQLPIDTEELAIHIAHRARRLSAPDLDRYQASISPYLLYQIADVTGPTIVPTSTTIMLAKGNQSASMKAKTSTATPPR